MIMFLAKPPWSQSRLPTVAVVQKKFGVPPRSPIAPEAAFKDASPFRRRSIFVVFDVDKVESGTP
jgi:hypothetical protein